MTVKQPGVQHFDWSSYVSKPRWASYWHQIEEVLEISPRNCLVVGSGDGVVVDVLRRRGVEVTTCDVVPELGPDIVADVRDLPMAEGAFDATLCCQVLEHIEFATVSAAIAELARVTARRVVISVPDQQVTLDVDVRYGAKRRYFRRFGMPRLKDWSFNGVHYWELGTRQSPVEQVREVFRRQLDLTKEYRVQENPYHRFFVLDARTCR